MAVNLRHRFVSQKEDGPGGQLLQPTKWNDTHVMTMAGPRLLGRTSSGDGNATEIVLGTGLSFDGNVLNSDTGPTGNFVQTSRTISTGAGLKGGGNLGANRTLSVDDTVMRTSGNQDITDLKKFTGDLSYNGSTVLQDTRRIDTGDGMAGGRRLNGDVTLQVNDTVVRTSGDQTVHGYKTFQGGLTHHGRTLATIYEGDWRDETNFPIGHMVLAYAEAAARNQSLTLRLESNVNRYHDRTTGFPTLSGVWRSRGNYNDGMLLQRVA